MRCGDNMLSTAEPGKISKDWNYAVFLSDTFDSKTFKVCKKCSTPVVFVGSDEFLCAFSCKTCKILIIVSDILQIDLNFIVQDMMGKFVS